MTSLSLDYAAALQILDCHLRPSAYKFRPRIFLSNYQFLIGMLQHKNEHPHFTVVFFLYDRSTQCIIN